MRRFHFRRHLDVTAAQAFDFAVTHQPDNHPKWEKEVVSVRRDGPLKVGTRGVMVRQEWGKVQEAHFEIVELVPGRTVAYRTGAGGFHLHLKLDFEPRPDGCELVVSNELTLTGALRLLWPVLWFAFPRNSRRISNDFANVLNATVSPPPRSVHAPA